MPATPKPRTVLCFGDSITWGFDPRGGEMFHRYPLAERWTQRLASKLGVNFHIVEEGLNGRTTVFDDPVLGGKSGLADIENVMKSHMPVDVLVIMLGSNDVKARFGVGAGEIAACLGRILEVIKNSKWGPDDKAPNILVLVPPTLGDLTGTLFENLFEGEKSQKKSEELRKTYPPVAAQYGAHCLDTSKVVRSSAIDGLHLDPDQLLPLANAVAESIRELFSASSDDH